MKISEKRGLLISQIPNLQVYTIKTPLIGRISIKTGFPWSQKLQKLEESLYLGYITLKPNWTKRGGKVEGDDKKSIAERLNDYPLLVGIKY